MLRFMRYTPTSAAVGGASGRRAAALLLTNWEMKQKRRGRSGAPTQGKAAVFMDVGRSAASPFGTGRNVWKQSRMDG